MGTARETHSKKRDVPIRRNLARVSQRNTNAISPDLDPGQLQMRYGNKGAQAYLENQESIQQQRAESSARTNGYGSKEEDRTAADTSQGPVLQQKTDTERPRNNDTGMMPGSGGAVPVNVQPLRPGNDGESPTLQPKLTVGEPNDAYEQEADRVADSVMQKSDTTVSQRGAGDLQRKADGAAAPIQDPASPASHAEPRQPPIMTKADGETPEPSSDFRGRLKRTKGGGSGLPDDTRAELESSIGADFGDVNVHTGSDAAAMNDELGAHAFTHGSDIYFNSGEYDPHSSEGKRLLAHELTHTVQQGASVRRSEDTARKTRDVLSEADTPNVQPAWYNFRIPGTNYRFDPSIEGVKTAAGLARDTATNAAGWVRDKAVEGFEWVVEQIQSLVSAGIEWLGRKFDEIKNFASTAFDKVKNGLSGLLGYITSPIGMMTSAFIDMNASLLSTAWSALKSGASMLWSGVRAVIDGVFAIGNGLWEAASGYVSTLFRTVNGLLNSWAFRQLPGFLQRRARRLFDGVRSLWHTIRDYITDALARLREFTDRILNAVESFIQNVVAYGIQKTIDTVRKIREVWDWVKRVAADPEGHIQPVIDWITNKLNAEAPPKAKELGSEKVREQAQSGAASEGGVIQRQEHAHPPERTTATSEEVDAGIWAAIDQAWSELNIRDMLWESFVTMFWPPATIRAIGTEFYELVMTDWANAAGDLFMPRNLFDDPAGFFHDVWSNFLILLDFPLALWRRLNAVVMLLLGYVTIILVLIGLIGGAIAGGGALSIPGALAGAKAGLVLAAEIGMAAMFSFIGAEAVTVIKTIVELRTARQTDDQKSRDYTQLAASLLGMAIAIVMMIIAWAIARLVSAVVRAIKARGGRGRSPEARPAEEGRPAADDGPPPADEGVDPATLRGRRPARPEHPVRDANGNLTRYGEWYYEKPGGYRRSLAERRQEIWDQAVRDAPDGIPRDPETGNPLSRDSFRIEEKPGQDFNTRQRRAAEQGKSRQEFLDEHNNMDNYRAREGRGQFSGPRPATPERPVLDAQGRLTEYGRWYYERPSGFRQGVRERVWQDAVNNSPDGVVRDPVTLEQISPNEPWDMGHRWGHEFRKHRASAARRGVSRQQFLDEHNNPSHYRPEKPASNRGHQGEAPDDVYLGP